jgi:hypothetical protein
MNVRSNIVVVGLVLVCVLAVVGLGGCATGKGGGADHVAALFDKDAEARIAMRRAAEKKFENAGLLIAAHNRAQESVAKNDQRKLVPWWLGENGGVCVASINGQAMSDVYSVWEAQARNRPTDSQMLEIWLEDMEGRKALFMAQADVLEAVAAHFESNQPAEMTAEGVTKGAQQLRDQALLIRGKTISLETPVTASLKPSDNGVVVAAADKSGGPQVTQKDLKGATKTASALQRGNATAAGTELSKVVFGK